MPTIERHQGETTFDLLGLTEDEVSALHAVVGRTLVPSADEEDKISLYPVYHLLSRQGVQSAHIEEDVRATRTYFWVRKRLLRSR